MTRSTLVVPVKRVECGLGGAVQPIEAGGLAVENPPGELAVTLAGVGDGGHGRAPASGSGSCSGATSDDAGGAMSSPVTRIESMDKSPVPVAGAQSAEIDPVVGTGSGSVWLGRCVE